MSESNIEVSGGQLQDFTIDQLAGASALVLGSIGGLLMIIWKSRCKCKCRLGLSDKCYVFDCSREPPPDHEDSDNEGQPNRPVAEANEERERLREGQDGAVAVEPVVVDEPIRQAPPLDPLPNPDE